MQPHHLSSLFLLLRPQILSLAGLLCAFLGVAKKAKTRAGERSHMFTAEKGAQASLAPFQMSVWPGCFFLGFVRPFSALAPDTLAVTSFSSVGRGRGKGQLGCRKGQKPTP